MEQSSAQENIPQTQLDTEAPIVDAPIVNPPLENQPLEQPTDTIAPATVADPEPQLESSKQKPKKSILSRILGGKKDKDKQEDPVSDEPIQGDVKPSHVLAESSTDPVKEVPEADEQKQEGLMKRLSSMFQRKKSEKPTETEPEAAEPKTDPIVTEPVIEKPIESPQIPEPETVIESKDEPEAVEEMEKVQENVQESEEKPKSSFGKLKSIFAKKNPEETVPEAEAPKEQKVPETVLEESKDPVKEALGTEAVPEVQDKIEDQVKEANAVTQEVPEENKSPLVRLKSLFTKTPEGEGEGEAAAESVAKEIQPSSVEPQEIVPEPKVQESIPLEQPQDDKVIPESLPIESEKPTIEEPKIESEAPIEEPKLAEPVVSESKPEAPIVPEPLKGPEAITDSIVPEQEQPKVAEPVVPEPLKEQENAPESVPAPKVSHEIPAEAVAGVAAAVGAAGAGVAVAASGQSEETKAADQDIVFKERMKRVGTLYKRGKYCHCNWKKRFFALAVNGEINYFHTSYCTRIHGTFHVNEHTKVEDLIEDNHDVSYELNKGQFIYPFDVVFQDQIVRFAAPSVQEKVSWIQSIRELISAPSKHTEEIPHEHIGEQCPECPQT